jgi:hypothetical protein
MTSFRISALLFASNVNGIDPLPVIVSDVTWIHDAVAEMVQVHV